MGSAEKTKTSGTICHFRRNDIYESWTMSGYKNKFDVYLRRGADESENSIVEKYYQI